MSDGCTGFWLFEWLFSITTCCRVHDLGGSDGTLLDCLMTNTPEWAWPFVAVGVTIMICLRPVYRIFKGTNRG